MTTNPDNQQQQSWEHDFNGAGVCRKCHTHKSEIINNMCPVISREELTR